MALQPDLFADWSPPIPPSPLPRAFARASDPVTSHLAAADIAVRLPELEEEVLRAVKIAGAYGATLDEICAVTGLDKVTTSPRLKPLERKGLVRRNGTRLGRARKQQTVWLAV
jgi:DNA-binding MarR family transcriptional regulator